MFIFELLIYVFFASIMYKLAKKSNQEEISRISNPYALDRYLWWYMIFFAVISAIRWRVGVDSVSYIEIFRKGEIREDSKEYLWDLLVRIIHNYGLHFVLGTFVAAFFQIFCLTDSLKRFRYLLIWLPLVLFGGRYYMDLMNGVRQMMVACGFVYLSKYIVFRKSFKFVIGIIILSCIHHSALMLIPIYFCTFITFDKIHFENKRITCLIILLICFILGQVPSFQNLIQYIEPIVNASGYENHADYYADLLKNKSQESLSMGPIMISTILLSIAIIWFSPYLKKHFENSIPEFDLWYFFTLLFSWFYFLFCNVGHMMIRPVQYFEFFMVIMLCCLLQYFFDNGDKKKLWYLITLIWICTVWSLFKDTGKLIEFSTYKTFFFHLK